jgi:hypothetical protein
MGYYRKHRLKVKAGFSVLLIAGLFSVKVKAAEEVYGEDMLVAHDKQNRSLLTFSPQNSETLDYHRQKGKSPCCLLSCFKSKLFWVVSLYKCMPCLEKNKVFIAGAVLTSAGKSPNLPSGVILEVASFLDYSDQLKLSHVNKEFRSEINETFWEKQILEQRYLLWDTTLPKAKIFFANYFYYKGFGRDPKLPEKISNKVEEIITIPNFLLAKKSLGLGFPKGQENYRQVQHKITVLRISREREARRLSVHCSLSPHSYQLLDFLEKKW